MDASLQARAEQLASEFAGQATTAEELNGLMRLMLKSALERMLNTEMDVHLGRRPLGTATEQPVGNGAIAGAGPAEAESPQRSVVEDCPGGSGRVDSPPCAKMGSWMRAGRVANDHWRKRLVPECSFRRTSMRQSR